MISDIPFSKLDFYLHVELQRMPNTILGIMRHTRITTTQLYAQITNQKVNGDMKVLSNRIENKYELPKDDIPEFTYNQYLYDKKMGRAIVEKGKSHRKKREYNKYNS
ncbi:MAG: hypothetical protein ACK5N4_03935 [Parabacteroides gordonii]|uniref:hypothetical protein n=1 Tax=Parabacteroides gordonii TaxID=574930 RepID=UPI003A8455C2